MDGQAYSKTDRHIFGIFSNCHLNCIQQSSLALKTNSVRKTCTTIYVIIRSNTIIIVIIN